MPKENTIEKRERRFEKFLALVVIIMTLASFLMIHSLGFGNYFSVMIGIIIGLMISILIK